MGIIHTKNIHGGMKMSNKTKKWMKYAFVRSVKTVAQTAIAMIGTTVLMDQVNWIAVLSASILSGVLSLLTSIAGLPEARG